MDLDIIGLGVTVAGAELLASLDISVGSGEVVGLVGPNGSGKSTALRCVYRALRPSTGVVRVGGDDVRRLPLRESARRVAALSQEGGADLDFTVGEVVALGRTPHKRGNEPLTSWERDLCRVAMERMDVAHLASRGVLNLSGGERQRVLVARALVQQPSLLILDEPTNHLDLRHQVELLGLVRHSGVTTVIVLHDLNLAAATCDRIGVLRAGRLVRIGAPVDVLTEELVAEVFEVAVSVVPHPLTGAPQILHSLGDQPVAAPFPRGPI